MQLPLSFFAVTILAIVAASPVNKKTNVGEADVMIVPLESQLYDLDDGDVGFPSGFFSFNPFGNPFSGFMQSMDEMLKNLREQMSQVLHRLPPDNVEWTEIADGKGNTTSTTKVVNGHKITINETTYKNEGDNSGSVFKIRIVDVHPTSDEDTEQEGKPADPNLSKDIEETTPQNNGNKESIEIEESANEIPQGAPEIDISLEGNIDMPGDEPIKENSQAMKNREFYKVPDVYSENDIDFVPLKQIETNEVNFPPYDLSRDTIINDIMQSKNAPHNPDAEMIDFAESIEEPSSFDPKWL